MPDLDLLLCDVNSLSFLILSILHEHEHDMSMATANSLSDVDRSLTVVVKALVSSSDNIDDFVIAVDVSGLLMYNTSIILLLLTHFLIDTIIISSFTIKSIIFE